MKKITTLLSILLVIGLIYFSFFSLMPNSGEPASIPETEFSSERALVTLKQLSEKPHYYGSKEHDRIGNFLLNELKNLGLETETQQDFVLNAEDRSLTKPKNIIGKLKGSSNGKALVLLSHYDSALIPSFGASDAGSGLVTILESLRAYNASGEQPKNDIIVVFSDAEEIGLDGAKLFVNQHRWAKNAGLVLNFEARGSGGPSNMILETNGGNANLIKAFIDANPEYPVASSLMYSVYKMLPNDTDSTIFREDGDIDSFFFAFIDDHFDYHTANDTFENLDRNTLQHQGSYLLPLMHYFGNTDLSNLKAETDDVYVNFPFVKMIHYPFSWILPMLIIAAILFIVLIAYGIKKRRLFGKAIGKGFLAFLGAMIGCGLIGFFGWKIILALYPQYLEIQHGFTYNGHLYIAFFVFLSVSILFSFYKLIARKDEEVASLMVAPLFIWIVVNTAVFIILKGAGYFIIPVIFGLLAFWLMLRQIRPNFILMLLLAIPALFFFSPLIQFFPVGLGLKMLVISCVFTVLLFGLLLSVFGFYKMKGMLSIMTFLVAIGFFLAAHFKSDFSETRQKPNSLLYFEDTDTQKAYWLTYDNEIDDWTKSYLGDSPQDASRFNKYASTSKYNRGYSFAAKAPLKNLPPITVVPSRRDSILNSSKKISFNLKPNRNINQISLYADAKIKFESLSFNGKRVSDENRDSIFNNRTDELLLRYYVDGNDSLVVNYTLSEEKPITFTVMEYSFDLLENPNFSIKKRPKNTMPKPFVVTDAVVLKKTFSHHN